MPGFDATGPQGKGTGTGGKRGICQQNNVTEQGQPSVGSVGGGRCRNMGGGGRGVGGGGGRGVGGGGGRGVGGGGGRGMGGGGGRGIGGGRGAGQGQGPQQPAGAEAKEESEKNVVDEVRESRREKHDVTPGTPLAGNETDGKNEQEKE